jgi:hypothetical protein
MEYTKYQQGDVVMLKVDDDYFKKNTGSGSDSVVEYHGKQPTHAIMAFGEVTGHTHQVNMANMLKEAGVTLHMGYNRKAGEDVPQGFVVHNKSVTLTHEEHDPIKLPPGKYIIKLVQEFNHITRRAQNVTD